MRDTVRDGCSPNRYRTIVADPPWPQGDYPTHLGGRLVLGRGRWQRPPLPYEPMSLDAIRALPVADLAAADCRLFCWATSRFLPDAFGTGTNQNHHWAPVEIFPHWPRTLTVWLCQQHHNEWHKRMRACGLRWPGELAR